jgi:hypothetical protein
MFRQISHKTVPFLKDLFRPMRPLLPLYTPQVSAAQALIIKLVGIAAVAVAGGIYGRFFATLPSDLLLILLAPLAVMALLVVWVLPDRDTAPTAAMSKLLLAFVAVSIAWPDYLALQLPGLPWISFRRLFLAPLVLLLLVSFSTNAQFRKEMHETLNAEPLLWKMMVAFVVIQLISVVGGPHPAAAFKNFVNYQLLWTGVFFVSVYAFRDRRVSLKFFRIFFIACMVIGLIAIVETQNQGVLWKNHVPGFLQVDLETMSGAMESALRFGQFRAKSVYSQPLPFAEIMAMVSPILLYFMFTVKEVWKRIGLIILDILLLYCLTLPQSRLGMIGFMAAHGLFILIWAGRIWLRHRFSIIGPTITLAYPVLLIGLAGAVMSVTSLRERVIGGNDTANSDQARKMQIHSARGVILRNPVIGYGPRQAAGVLGFSAMEGQVTLDNYFLWIALDYGLIGFGVYYGMFLLAIHRMFMITIRDVDEDNNQALTVLTALTAFILIKTVMSEEDNHSVAFMLLALAVAICWRDRAKVRVDTHWQNSQAHLSR